MIDRIFKLESGQPLSPYAMDFDFSLSRSIWDDQKKLDTIKNFCLKKEKEILELDYTNDGGTGLDEDAVTTRFGRYNLFDFVDECPELTDLWNFIKEHWIDRIEIDATKMYKTKIGCWFNVMRKGQHMNEHRHSSRFSGYLSGNMHLDNYETVTTYKHLNNWIELNNIKGGLVMFPSQLLHSTSTHTEKNERVSIAFDLHLTNLNDVENEILQHSNKDFYI
tara:strand:- start:1167 stop:1829 length:663 start_codon:yes stop_codon:yes gene_type:complete